MKQVDGAVISTATLALSMSFSAFNSFLPPLSEVRKQTEADNPPFAADVRLGELAAAALTVGIGGISSSLTGSPVPAVVSVIMALGLVMLYESTLRAHRPLERL
jgi:hypothetical protein